jgi:hypothetical protein
MTDHYKAYKQEGKASNLVMRKLSVQLSEQATWDLDNTPSRIPAHTTLLCVCVYSRGFKNKARARQFTAMSSYVENSCLIA